MEEKNDYYLNEKCAKYLESIDINSFLIELKKKYKTYGSFTGTIKIKEKEKEALTRVVGFSVGQTIKVQQFIDALNNSRYKGIDLLEVLKIYFKEDIVTNKQSTKNKEQQIENKHTLLLTILKEKKHQELNNWLDDLFNNKNKLYLTLLSDEGETILKNLLCALDVIETNNSYLPIAVFSSMVTGNPHYFDKDSTADRILISALSFLNGQSAPTNSMERKVLLSDFNLSSDEIAGNVVLYQVELYCKDGLHKGAHYTYIRKQPFVCSKANLVNIVSMDSISKKIFIVENEMVFSYLQKSIKRDDVGLICTSGQLSSTAQEIIKLLCESKNDIYYAGDLDPEGILIAYNLKQNYSSINYWHMTKTDYQKGLSKEKINDRRIAILDKIDDQELNEVIEYLKYKKLAAYQENILDLYVQDLK